MLKLLLSNDFRHTAINQIWKLVSSPLLLILIPLFLTPETQGYWFTFISLSALSVLADMGFSTILLQFSAHEFAHLNFSNNKEIVGTKKHMERLATLWKFSLKRLTVISLIFFPVILIAGYYFLKSKNNSVEWIIPWVIYCIASVWVFINNMIFSFIEGCDSVGDIQKIRFYVSVTATISSIFLLILKTDLYALSISLLISAITGTIIIMHQYSSMFKQLSHFAKNSTYSWTKEIMPLLWRYALSWISGYFIFSIFTPIAFHFYGSVEAGKIGLSIAVCTAIYGIANIWITIIRPKINILIAQKKYKTLDAIFSRHLKLSLFTYICEASTLAALLYSGYLTSITERLVSPFSLSLLLTGWLLQIVVNSYAIYIRSHKYEPFSFLSILNAAFIFSSTLYISNFLPSEYFFLGFLSSYTIVIFGTLFFYKKLRLRILTNGS